MAYTLESTDEGLFTCTAQTRYNAEGEALTRTQKQLISQLSPTLAEKAISTNERGLTSTDWTVYNESTKRTRYSTEPTSNITAKSWWRMASRSRRRTRRASPPPPPVASRRREFTPTYDADGNQTLVKTSTGIWTVAYNAENRPVTFTRSEEDGTETQVTCTYDYMGRRATKQVTENGSVTFKQRYIYRDYLQIACCDLTRANHPCLWLITWDPTQPIATRPLAIQKDGTWYAYGWDLTKNICEVLSSAGYINTIYTYTPYGAVTSSGNTTQPLQWSSEYSDTELGLVYYNYRHYNPIDGRWLGRDVLGEAASPNVYGYVYNKPYKHIDYTGLVIDTIWDVGNMIWDVGAIVAGAATGDGDMVEEGATDLLLDTAAAFIPGVPAGVSKIARASSKAAKASKGAKKTKGTKKGMYTCTVSGGMIQLDKNVCCDGWIEGVGVHKNRSQAIKLAKRDANSKVPRECQGKHLNPVCVKG